MAGRLLLVDLKLILMMAAIAAVLLTIAGLLAWRWTRGEVRVLLNRTARLPFGAKLRLAKALIQDNRIPLASRAILPGLFLYLALPIDIVPDFIPVLVQLDDVLIALAAVGLFLRSTPRAILEEHLRRLEAAPGPVVLDQNS